MIININRPYGLNFGTDLEYISTYMKGKKGSQLKDFRILTKRVDNGEEILLYLEDRPNFFGRDRYAIGYINIFKRISPNHIKNKVYNYYDNGYNPSDVEEFFEAWKNSDPMAHIGNLQHSFISKIPRYTYSYKFNNKQY